MQGDTSGHTITFPLTWSGYTDAYTYGLERLHVTGAVVVEVNHTRGVITVRGYPLSFYEPPRPRPAPPARKGPPRKRRAHYPEAARGPTAPARAPRAPHVSPAEFSAAMRARWVR